MSISRYNFIILIFVDTHNIVILIIKDIFYTRLIESTCNCFLNFTEKSWIIHLLHIEDMENVLEISDQFHSYIPFCYVFLTFKFNITKI